MTDWTSELLSPAKPQSPEAPTLPVEGVSMPEGLHESAIRGATLGFSDEVGAAGRATADAIYNLATGKPVRWRESYEEGLEDIRKRQKQFAEDSPQAAFWGEILGSLGGGAGAGAKAVSGAKSLLGTIGKSATSGAKIGAVAGVGHAEGGWSERLIGAGTGAGAGAVIGGGLSGATAGLIKAIEISARALPKSTKREMAVKVAEALARDEITPEQAQVRLRQIGDKAFLADVGENIRRLGGAAARMPGPTRTKATSALERRQRHQHQRIVQKTREALGSKGEYFQQIKDLLLGRKNAAQAAYDAAYAAEWAPVGEGGATVEGLAALLKTDPVKRAWIAAQKLAETEKAVGVLASDYRFPAFDGQEIPDTRAVDYIKQALDDRVTALFRAGRGKEANAVRGVRDKLKEIADDLNPLYKEARAVYEGPSHSLDMLKAGRDFTKGEAFYTAEEIAKMSPADKAFFREGVGQKIADIVKGKKEDADKVAALLRTPQMREKLAAVFESPAKYFKWLRQMLGEEKMNKTLRELRGSPTAERLQDQEGVTKPGLLRDVIWAIGDNPFAKMRLYERVQSRVTAAPRERVAAELANLFSDDPEMQALVLNAAKRAAPVAGLKQAIPAAIGQAGAAQSYRPEAKAAVTMPGVIVADMWE